MAWAGDRSGRPRNSAIAHQSGIRTASGTGFVRLPGQASGSIFIALVIGLLGVGWGAPAAAWSFAAGGEVASPLLVRIGADNAVSHPGRAEALRQIHTGGAGRPAPVVKS